MRLQHQPVVHQARNHDYNLQFTIYKFKYIASYNNYNYNHLAPARLEHRPTRPTIMVIIYN
jgi:hypothetical protein